MHINLWQRRPIKLAYWWGSPTMAVCSLENVMSHRRLMPQQPQSGVEGLEGPWRASGLPSTLETKKLGSQVSEGQQQQWQKPSRRACQRVWGQKAKACVSLTPLCMWAASGRLADHCGGRFTPSVKISRKYPCRQTCSACLLVGSRANKVDHTMNTQVKFPAKHSVSRL